MEQIVSTNNKRIVRNTLLLYVRTFFVTIIALFTSRIILKTLGLEDFGIYNVVGGIVAMMAVLNSAITVSMQRYLAYEIGKGDDEKLRNTFSMCINIYLILAVFLLAFSESIGLWILYNKLIIPVERLSAAYWVFQFSVVTCINTLLFTPYNSMIIANEKMDFIALISIIDAFLKLGIVCFLAIAPFDKLVCYSALLLLESLLYTSACRIYCLHKFPASHYAIYWHGPMFKELLSYTGWNFLGSISVFAKTQGLNILLNMFFNPAVNAARGIAYQVNNALLQFFNGFSVAVTPQITKYYAQKNWQEFFNLVIRSSKFSFYLILFCSLPVYIEAPFIIHLWLGQIPEYVIPFFRLIIIITAVDAMSSPLTAAINANGNIKHNQVTVSILTLMNMPISYLFLKSGNFSPSVVYVISLCLSFACLFVRLLWIGRLMPFPYIRFFREVLLRIIVVMLLSFVFSKYTHDALSFTSFQPILTIIMCILSVLLLILSIGISKEERASVMEFIMNRFHDIRFLSTRK